MAYLYTATEKIGTYGRHRAYVKYTTSSTATTYKITINEVGEHWYSTYSSADTYSTSGTSTVSYSGVGSGSRTKSGISASVSTTTTKYIQFGSDISSTQTYNMSSSSDSVTLKVTWKWSSVNKSSSVAITIPRARRVTVSFHVNGGNIPDNPHKYSDSLYFKKPSDSNFIWYCSTANGTYEKYTKYIYTTTTGWDAYNFSSFGLSRTGYSRNSGAEWNLNSSGTSTSFGQDTEANWTSKRLNGGTEITEDVSKNVYAQWVENTANLTYHASGISGATLPSPNPQTMTYSAATTLKAATAPSGYTLYGWSSTLAKAQAGTRDWTSTATYKNANVDPTAATIYACWTSTLSYNANGHNTAPSSVTMKYSTAVNAASALANTDGYEFTGWNTKADGSGTSYAAGAQVKAANAYKAGLTLYAQWSLPRFTATVVSANTNQGTVTGGGTYTTGTSITITATPKTGYHFTGWTYSNGWTGSNSNASVTFTITSSGTATASFAGNSYSVAFNANGGSGSMTTQTGFVYGTGKTLSSNAFTAPAGGYSFYGWATSAANAAAGTRAYTDGGTMTTGTSTNGGTVTLYAIWQRTLTFKSSWASSQVTSTATQFKGGNVTMPAPSALSSGNWTGLGWRDDNTAGAKEYGGSAATAVAYTGTTTTLYSVYSRTLTISYAANGGSGTTPSNTTATQYYNSAGYINYPTVTLASNPYTYSGKTFTGWLISTSNTTINSGGSYTWDNIGTTATTYSRTATAQWSANVYTLTINPDGGVWNGSASTQTITGTSGSTLNIIPPQKAGSIFVGWAEIGSGSLSKHVKGNPVAADTDPSFDSSVSGVGVYNNSGGGTVTHTRQSSSAGYGSYEIAIATSTGTTSPGLGGFYHNTISSANKTYIHSFVAKLPVGYTLMYAQNGTGNNRSIAWLTSRDGTGAYKTYAYIHRCGTDGTFSTFGHVYVDSGTKPVTWNLACSNMIDITNGFNEVYTFGAGNGTLVALWADIEVWCRIGGAWKQAKQIWTRIDGTWKATPGLWAQIDGSIKGPYYGQNLFIGTDMSITPTAVSTDFTQYVKYYNTSSSNCVIDNQIATITLNAAGNLGIAFARLASEVSLDSNSWYTISCEAKSTQTTNPLCIGLSYYKTDNTWYWNGGNNPQYFNKANEWQTFTVTFKPAADTQALYYCFTVAGASGGTSTFSIRHCKLEKGVYATPWTGALYTEYNSTDPSLCSHSNAISTTIEYCLDAGYNCGCGDYQHYKICPNCGSVYVDEPTLQNYMICDDCSETLADWEPLINRWILPTELDTLLPDLKNATEYTDIYNG